jgi:hypothetical protein
MVSFVERDVEDFRAWELCIHYRLQLRSLIEVKFISEQSKVEGLSEDVGLIDST